MIRRLAFGALVFALAAAAWFRVDKALRVVPNFTAETLCRETFVSDRDPALAFAQIPAKTPGMKHLSGITTWSVDRQKREARAVVAGLLAARAVHVDGCRHQRRRVSDGHLAQKNFAVNVAVEQP